MKKLDKIDLEILKQLQKDSSISLEEIAKKINSSKTPVWNRIKRLKENGYIVQNTVILDHDLLGFEACFFVLIRTNAHELKWHRSFLDALMKRSEVLEAHRLAGDVDYILKVRVKNAKAYDVFYQKLIEDVRIHNVTSLLSMEEIKYSCSLPL